MNSTISRLTKTILINIRTWILKPLSRKFDFIQRKEAIDLLCELPSFRSELIPIANRSNAQRKQDIFVLNHLGLKRGGYFVEFGACDGKMHSNTFLLEKDFQWRGILCEPASGWHNQLKSNRNCIIETKCVWHTSGISLDFNEVPILELSTIDTYSKIDRNKYQRVGGKVYPVETISLSDLLKKHNAPAVIDFLSIDTEGSEYDILKSFNFDIYKFQIICCEHNYGPNRQKIYDLLTKVNYRRVHTNISRWDDWYVSQN